MGFLSRFEGKMEDTFEGAADRMANSPISPVQIAKKAEKQMRREKMVGAGKQFAPTLYTVLVNPDDDRRLFGYYPTLAGETETYLAAKAAEQGLVMDGQPLVRFIVDDGLKHGKFDIIAEAVAAPIIAQLRQEEMQRYGLAGAPMGYAAPQGGYGAPGYQGGYQQPYAQAPAPAPAYAGYENPNAPMGGFDAPGQYDAYNQGGQLPYVPEDEIDRSIDYGEYTFDSRDFDESRRKPRAARGRSLRRGERQHGRRRGSCRRCRHGRSSSRSAARRRSRRHRRVRRRAAGSQPRPRAGRRARALDRRGQQPRVRPSILAPAHRTRIEK